VCCNSGGTEHTVRELTIKVPHEQYDVGYSFTGTDRPVPSILFHSNGMVFILIYLSYDLAMFSTWRYYNLGRVKNVIWCSMHCQLGHKPVVSRSRRTRPCHQRGKFAGTEAALRERDPPVAWCVEVSCIIVVQSDSAEARGQLFGHPFHEMGSVRNLPRFASSALSPCKTGYPYDINSLSNTGQLRCAAPSQVPRL
jgi:hypothetical protein